MAIQSRQPVRSADAAKSAADTAALACQGFFFSPYLDLRKKRIMMKVGGYITVVNPEEIDGMNSYEKIEKLTGLYFQGVGDAVVVDFLLQTQKVEADPEAVPDLANRDPETGDFYEPEE